jgi:hypothetical protein
MSLSFLVVFGWENEKKKKSWWALNLHWEIWSPNPPNPQIFPPPNLLSLLLLCPLSSLLIYLPFTSHVTPLSQSCSLFGTASHLWKDPFFYPSTSSLIFLSQVFPILFFPFLSFFFSFLCLFCYVSLIQHYSNNVILPHHPSSFFTSSKPIPWREV